MPSVRRSRPHRPAGRDRHGLAAVALLVTSQIVAACGPEPAADAAILEGLLVLTAESDRATTLAIWTTGETAGEGPTMLPAPLTAPRPGTAWISSGRAHVLAATVLDGTVYTSDPVDPGRAELTWREVDALDPRGDPPPTPAWFVSWDPEGGRFATITGDLPGGGDVELTLIDPSTSGAFVIPLERPLLAAAPTWLDGDRVAVVGGSTADPVAVIVDTATSDVTDGPAGDRRLATSADGARIATVGGPGSPVIIRSTGAWLAADGASIGSVDAPSTEAVATAMALDATGDRLAIVWQGIDGGLRIDVHDGRDGWRRTASPTLEGRQAAVVAWSR